VILLSGGLDSSTVLAVARSEGFAPHALTVRYGQRHAKEVEAARRVAEALRAERHVVVDVDLAAFGGSALTAPDIPVPRNALGDQPGGIPSTYVPARNAVLLSLALAYAETVGAADLYIGVNAVDYSGYPDCRPEFVAAFERMANLATRAGVAEGRTVRVRAPLVDLSKAEIIRLGLSLGVDYGLTHSCYDPDASGRPCGECDSCLLRARGFAEAGVADPVLGSR
jgi:7-cyano-7-deazaguanine synthase